MLRQQHSCKYIHTLPADGHVKIYIILFRKIASLKINAEIYYHITGYINSYQLTFNI